MQPQQQRVQLRVIAAVCGGLADLGDPVVGDGPSWPGCAAAAPGSGPCMRCTTTPAGRLVFHVFAWITSLSAFR